MDSQRIAFLFSKEEYFSKSILDLVKRKKGHDKTGKMGIFFSPMEVLTLYTFDRYYYTIH